MTTHPKTNPKYQIPNPRSQTHEPASRKNRSQSQIPNPSPRAPAAYQPPSPKGISDFARFPTCLHTPKPKTQSPKLTARQRAANAPNPKSQSTGFDMSQELTLVLAFACKSQTCKSQTSNPSSSLCSWLLRLIPNPKLPIPNVNGRIGFCSQNPSQQNPNH